MSKKVNKTKRKKLYRKWHSWLGLFLFFPLIFFTVTGVLLNHSSDLELDKKRVQSEWVMERYGLSFDSPPICYRLTSGKLASSWQGQILLGNKIVTEGNDIIGASQVSNGICIASTERVHYVSNKGELIESLDALVLPEGELKRIGSSADGTLVIQAGEGYYKFDSELVEATPLNDVETVVWSTQGKADEKETASLKKSIIGTGMPLDRVILDVHSGNLFGTFGKVVVDLFGIGILAVSVTGLILFFRAKKRRQSCNKVACKAPCSALNNEEDSY